MSDELRISFDLELGNYLRDVVDLAASSDRLIQDLEERGLESNMLRSLASFLWHARLPDRILSLCSRHIFDENLTLPWDFILESLWSFHGANLPDAETEALREVFLSPTNRLAACRSKIYDHLFPELRIDRAELKLSWIKYHHQQKNVLIEHLSTLRTQQLYEQEKNLLERLQKLYPKDAEVEREVKNHKERYALEILARHKKISQSLPQEWGHLSNEDLQLKKAIAQSLLRASHQEPELIRDFAIAAANFDCLPESLQIIGKAPANEFESRWLQAELLLLSGRYVDLLFVLSRLEIDFAHLSETFFASAYMRAQAFWGLGQKQSAIDIMESLAIARPQYRSALSLLSLWRAS